VSTLYRPEIRKVAGQQDLATTQHYMHLSPTALDAAIRLLEEPSRGPAKAGPQDECRGEMIPLVDVMLVLAGGGGKTEMTNSVRAKVACRPKRVID